MSRRRRIFNLTSRKHAKTDKVLNPLLWRVEPVAPPEGLLRQIESRIDTPKQTPEPTKTLSWAWPIAGATFAAALALVVALTFEGSDGVLKDPSGRVIADVKISGSDATLIANGHNTSNDAEMSWHLWGFEPDNTAPVLIGSFSETELLFQNYVRFERYAMSLETRGFSSSLPQGVVVPLVLEK